MGVVQVIFVRPGSSNRTFRHLHFINMNFITVSLSVLLLATAVKTETFAEKLAVFIGDTPAGYTVSQMVKNGENCHCRVPGSSSSSSSSSQFVTTTAAASSVLSLTTELDPTTTDATTTDATTTDATTTVATTTDTTTAGTTTGTITGGGSSALTADFDTFVGSAGR